MNKFVLAVVCLISLFLSFSVGENKVLRFKRKNGKIDVKYRWQNATIPFEIDETLITPNHTSTIAEAMKSIENSTCVRFVNHTRESDYVFITGGADACISKIGKRGGKQVVKLVKPNGGGCHTVGKILHEFLHLLGFYHLHKSPDRDDHIKIKWENVKSGYEYELSEKGYDEVTNFGTPYDYDSLLHVKNTKYSKNGGVTIETKNPQNRDRIGQRIGLSAGDIDRINKMYKCKKSK